MRTGKPKSPFLEGVAPRRPPEAARYFRHRGRLDIGEGEAQIILLVGPEHAAGQAQDILLLGEAPGDAARFCSGEGMAQIGEISPGADDLVAGIVLGESGAEARDA